MNRLYVQMVFVLLFMLGLAACGTAIQNNSPTPTLLPPTDTLIPPTVAPSATLPPTDTPIPPTETATLAPSPTRTVSTAQAQLTELAARREALYQTQTAQPTPKESATPRPNFTSTATPNVTVNRLAGGAAQTAEAARTATALETCLKDPASPQDWSLVMCDLFDEMTQNWYVGKNTDMLSSGSFSLLNGLYRWDFNTNTGVVQRIEVNVHNLGDFYSSVQAQRVAGAEDSSYGIYFRSKGDDYYFFHVWDNGDVSLDLRYQQRWSNLYQGKAASGVQSGKPNLVAVEAQGNRFALYLNGQLVGTVQDSHIGLGSVGLGIDVHKGKQATIDFDQFLLLAPKANSKPRPITIKPAAQPTKLPFQATQPPSSQGCPLDPGNAGILVINELDGLMTFTILNHEYKLEPHTQLLVQVPGDAKFTVSVSVVGVGKASIGPTSLPAGQCVTFKPYAG
ncbi:MAG TPA: hypothetical protein VFD70_14335 [Anaerolineae bacterium]|nr:hypothetical protein [Anaerolineae bacterium]